MKDLQEQIREKADKYAGKVLGKNDDDFPNFHSGDIEMAYKNGANFILSKWQESERWRKVSQKKDKEQIIKEVRTLILKIGFNRVETNSYVKGIWSIVFQDQDIAISDADGVAWYLPYTQLAIYTILGILEYDERSEK